MMTGVPMPFPLSSRIQSLPATVLLDRQGRVARTFVGAVTFDEVAADVQELLQERL